MEPAVVTAAQDGRLPLGGASLTPSRGELLGAAWEAAAQVWMSLPPSQGVVLKLWGAAVVTAALWLRQEVREATRSVPRGREDCAGPFVELCAVQYDSCPPPGCS